MILNLVLLDLVRIDIPDLLKRIVLVIVLGHDGEIMLMVIHHVWKIAHMHPHELFHIVRLDQIGLLEM